MSDHKCIMQGSSGGGVGEEWGSGGKVGVSLLNDRNISVAFAT